MFVVLEVLCCVILEVYLKVSLCAVIPEVRGCTLEFSFVVGSCSQRPRFRPNKGFAHNLAIVIILYASIDLKKKKKKILTCR